MILEESLGFRGGAPAFHVSALMSAAANSRLVKKARFCNQAIISNVI